MKLSTVFLAVALALGSATIVQAATSDVLAQDLAQRDAINRSLAPLHSADDLAAFTASGRASALDALAPLDRAVFLQSLQFGPDGLSRYDATALRGLTTAQAYQVLALFGAQAHAIDIQPSAKGAALATADRDASRVVPMLEPLKGFRCAGHSTCSEDPSSACTDNCK
ncbi:hypothetical protein [Luteibacter sp. 9135]|uniref:hypothetical protein n=1 Tax=Luteibacter sp. 9135 TaxID=1500893 RepID=UPI00163A4F06|nr:hypothetical protein [Luteibacter sp. 9135]